MSRSGEADEIWSDGDLWCCGSGVVVLQTLTDCVYEKNPLVRRTRGFFWRENLPNRGFSAIHESLSDIY